MKVLHINVRLLEGGAARIALDLHKKLLSMNVESRFAYGWGEKGRKSTGEKYIPCSFQVGQQIQVASNILIHNLVGIDYLPPVGARRKNFVEAINWTDVVHLHVIHSYYLPFPWLFKELIKANKPIVWTAHDYWMLTGRCASIEGCTDWRKGCGSCPTQKNYPTGYLDFSASQFILKRKLLAGIGSRLHVVTPTNFLAKSIKEGLPDTDVRVILNWIDSEFEIASNEIQLKDSHTKLNNGLIKLLVIAYDLSDVTKVDRVIVNKILKFQHIEVHTIGLNSPFKGCRVVNHGRIVQRDHMVNLITSTDIGLFTSEKDTFGLVMIEVLACGIPVLAVNSSAANEVLSKLGIKSISHQEIIELLTLQKINLHLIKNKYSVPRSQLLSVYGINEGINAYCELYEECLFLD